MAFITYFLECVRREKLQKLQNRAIRVITKSSYDTSSRFLLNSLGWDDLSVRRAKQKANLMYKCINNLAPAYLCNLFAPRTPNHDFRYAKKTKPRTDYLKRSFSYSGAILGNNLPEEIRTSNSLGFFWEVPIDGFLINTPTQQIRKTVFENF